MRQAAFALAAMVLLNASASEPPTLAAPDDGPLVAIGEGTSAGAPLTVMTYNVRGLPWPVAEDRPPALAAIGDRLAAMRRRGDAPQVVVLQEAFTGDARAIAARAGYRYVVEGPAAGEAPPAFAEPPLGQRYRMRGEGYGAWISSGLVLMSDYPVERAWRAAFPRTACAGWDCLANKGIMLARIRVPGLTLPVEIATAHMNSRLPTRTPVAHANAAYLRQLAAVDRFLAAHSDRRLPLIFAADLNLDSDRQRIAGLEASHAGSGLARDGEGGGAVVAICARPRFACRPGIGFTAIEPGKRNNDWQIFASGRDAAVRATGTRILFRPDAESRTLSDHQGLAVQYRLSATPRERRARYG